ncbi:tripartite tricarboxylate transporter permease [Halobaculum sp. D14]|uniref:tripartite tricarboxylate transporter permease n=1 Tax=Halobaculum sp. D14 TaxID=3421642 RepID=UPI003EBF9985
MLVAPPPAAQLPLVVPAAAATLVAYTVAGCALGCLSGLLPGLHANNFAMLLAAVAPAVDAPPLPLGCAMLSAGVVHTFLDVVPSLALGVPDAAMAVSALPGHRLVIEGRGREALRLSALGSGGAILLAVPAAVPLTAAMRAAYGELRAALPLLLLGVVVALVASEPTWRRRVGGAVAFLLAASLGHAALSLPVRGALGAGGVLTPLFAGLFGAPVLLDALDGDGVPAQADARLALGRRDVAATTAAGTAAGAAVGYLPGVSAGVASTLALPLTRGRDPAREYVVATSGANTATAVFALFAFTALDAPRSGVLVAMRDAGVPAALPTFVPVVVVAAAVGFLAVLVVGDAAFRIVGAVNQRRLVGSVLALLVALSWLFAGAAGVVVLAAAAVVGLVPPRLGCRRVHLMGVLLGPLVVGG